MYDVLPGIGFRQWPSADGYWSIGFMHDGSVGQFHDYRAVAQYRDDRVHQFVRRPEWICRAFAIQRVQRSQVSMTKAVFGPFSLLERSAVDAQCSWQALRSPLLAGGPSGCRASPFASAAAAA